MSCLVTESQLQICGGVKPVNGISTTPLVIYMRIINYYSALSPSMKLKIV